MILVIHGFIISTMIKQKDRISDIILFHNVFVYDEIGNIIEEK